MPMDTTRTRQCLKDFDLKTLFIEELGWDHHNATLEVPLDGQPHRLSGIAQKRGMVAFVSSGDIPDYPTRRKIERQVAKSAHEHLIIFTDPNKRTQTWQWVKREAGKPSACREHTYHRDQPGDALIQKLQTIAFGLDEEETLTIAHVTGRARAAFDVERVTKRFYDRFKTEHAAFLNFINGIPDDELHRWYASVMLNRLMFIYFIQKKGFLDKDTDYLRTKLAQIQDQGKGRFYSRFLCPLFFEGFAKKPAQRSAATNKLLGKVPYLNGGIFQRHQIEQRHGKAIQITDAAFEQLFSFFEQYHWNLDERPLRDDNEINPDVLGYIFEKYINQKQMGAYYTKEDITGYISKYTILPFLFETAHAKCKIAFQNPNGPTIWDLPQADPDRYIYKPVRHGMTWNYNSNGPNQGEPLTRPLALPPEIASGLNEVSKRTGWNKPASKEYALPTEIWREVVARRRRYEEVRAKMVNGEICDINDLITYNLDIRQFAQDVIENCEGPELLRAFWHAIEKITVLDPTCGSGAFLFAALNILEPLYEACLDRMEVFVADLDHSGRKHRPEKFSDFRKILARVAEHPNRRYFVLKSIIVNNLYGVDIMEEAIEICKLRLFLKLVAQVEQAEAIEPLPDIDFNIRAGNTLVGYATYDAVQRAVSSKLDFDNMMGRIEEKAREVDRLFELFRQQQTELGGEVTSEDKQALRDRLKALEDELNRYLACEYGVAVAKADDYGKWLKSHKPFHWFIEFHSIMKQGGFDAVIGNPPYVDYTKIKNAYTIRGFQTENCGNLYAYVMERSYSLLNTRGRFGMIIPVSSISGDSYKSLADITFSNDYWVSSYSNRPGKLFRGVEQRLVIFLRSMSDGVGYTTNYKHWYEEERESLFALLSYFPAEFFLSRGVPYKIGSHTESLVLKKLNTMRESIILLEGAGKHLCWFHDGPTYWIRGLPFEPESNTRSGRSNHYHRIVCPTHENAMALCAILNSSTFYYFFKSISNCRDFGVKELYVFPLSKLNIGSRAELCNLGLELGSRLKRTAKDCSRVYPSGKIQYKEYYPAISKNIIDKIDLVLGKEYHFTDEELDFIINHDIKYRMGRDSKEKDTK